MILRSHLLSMIIYAAFTAIVLSLVRRETPQARLKYGLFLFGVMLIGALLFGWFMFLFIR
jgi:hypothetical protein